MAADPGVLEGLNLIDADSRYSEPHDLWTSRAPATLPDLIQLPTDAGEAKSAPVLTAEDVA